MTGASDIHKLIATETKTNFVKNIPKIKDSRDYKNFDLTYLAKS